MDGNLTFSMAGSGNWRRWFPEGGGEFYLRCYRSTPLLADLSEAQRETVAGWLSAGFVSVESGRIRPRTPMLTGKDLETLEDWFASSADAAAAVIGSNLGRYEALVESLSDGRVSRDCLLAILVYAQTLDLGTLNDLERGIMGVPPRRGDSGSYFFWGQTVPTDSRLYYGVNGFGTDHFMPRYIWSSRFERRAEKRKSIAIPVFDQAAMGRIRALCGAVARQLGELFTSRFPALKLLIPSTSFASCDTPDVLCMVFHWGYGRIAQSLIAQGIMPEFPAAVDDGWGFWVEWQD